MTDTERRRLRRWIDVATDHCERHNLAEDYAVPGWILDLVVVLQDANHLEISPPKDTVQAHGQLLDLRECYMPFRTDLELPEEPDAGASASAMQVRQGDPQPAALGVPGGRKVKRLIRRALAALTS